MTVDGRLAWSSARRVGVSSLPVRSRPRARWKLRSASLNDSPSLPSITPGEKPWADISTCAWNSSPLIGEPWRPGGTHGFAAASRPGIGGGSIGGLGDGDGRAGGAEQAQRDTG